MLRIIASVYKNWLATFIQQNSILSNNRLGRKIQIYYESITKTNLNDFKIFVYHVGEITCLFYAWINVYSIPSSFYLKRHRIKNLLLSLQLKFLFISIIIKSNDNYHLQRSNSNLHFESQPPHLKGLNENVYTSCRV